MKAKILIALSDVNLANSIMNRLTSHGYLSEFVSSGNDIIHELKKINPSLLLIDIKLKDKSGYEVLCEKSLDREVTKIPVIIISNSGDPVRMKEIPSTPSIKDYMITLHIDIEVLVKKVDKILNNLA